MGQVRLEEFNQWWLSRSVDPDLALQFRRDAYHSIRNRLKSRFIISLTGLRRIGKTTIMYQLIADLLARGVDATDILFFSFDDTQAHVGEVLESYKFIHEKDFRAGRIYVFFDEIQKCQNWENEIKKYYDLYPKMKFVISGSGSLFIRKRTKETLAGRMFEISLGTFTFPEYLRFNGVTSGALKYETRVKPLFRKFVEKGGFPETFSLSSDREFIEYVRALVVDKIVYQDIPKTFAIDDPELLGVILELISSNPGMYVDYQSLSGQLGKDRRVIKSYIDYLSSSFLVRLLGNYRKGGMTTLRKMKRAYPADNALIYLYRRDRNERFFGRMVEASIINMLDAKAFWKDSGEVDAIVNSIPVESKYQESISAEDFKVVREFMRKFSVGEGMIITKNDERVIRFDEGRVSLVPAHKFMLRDDGLDKP